MNTLTVQELINLIKDATGSADEHGNACINIDVKNASEAIATKISIKNIKKKLKLLKRHAAHIQAQIRAINSYDLESSFLSDLLLRNLGEHMICYSSKDVSFTKQILASIYKKPCALIDELVLKIDGMVIQLDEYVQQSDEGLTRD